MTTSVNPIPKQDGREYIKSMEVRFDFTAAGPALGTHTHTSVFTLPAGARVVGGEVVVDTAGVGPSTSTIDIGDVDTDRYTASAIDLKTAARTALTLTGYRYAETDGIDFEIVNTTTGPLTAGVFYVRIEYVVDGRVNEVQE
jgi:hypothetical protein